MAITEAQRTNRNKGIFASDIPRIMGGGAVRLVLEKLGEFEPANFDDVIEVEIGQLIEGRILDAYQQERPGLTLERNAEALEFFHKQYPWLGCHPDALAVNRSVNVEAKAVGDYRRHEFGEGGDEVPASII